MNWKQKLLTITALLALLFNAENAPWTEITTWYELNEPPLHHAIIIHAPIWSPPELGAYTIECHLNVASLLGTWLVIGAACAGLFFLLKTKSKKTSTGESSKFAQN